MSIADDQLHTVRTLLHQAFQEVSPVQLLLAERNGDVQGQAPAFQDFVNKAAARLICVEEISLPYNRSVITTTLRVDTSCTQEYISVSASINARSLRNPFYKACG